MEVLYYGEIYFCLCLNKIMMNQDQFDGYLFLIKKEGCHILVNKKHLKIPQN
jgi:hypothetical protein